LVTYGIGRSPTELEKLPSRGVVTFEAPEAVLIAFRWGK